QKFGDFTVAVRQHKGIELVDQILVETHRRSQWRFALFVVVAVVVGLKLVFGNFVIAKVFVYIDILGVYAIFFRIIIIIKFFVLKLVFFIFIIVFFSGFKRRIFIHFFLQPLFKSLRRQLDQLHQLDLLRR